MSRKIGEGKEGRMSERVWERGREGETYLEISWKILRFQPGTGVYLF